MSLAKRLKFLVEAYRQAGRAGLFDDPGKRGESLLAGLLQRAEPPRRGTRELMRAYRQLPWLRSVTSRISMAVAGAMWEVFVVTDGEGRALRRPGLQRADRVTREAVFARLKASGDLRQIEQHPLLDLIDNANPLMTGRTARQLTQVWLDLKGEAFWIMERNGAGMPIEIWPVPPHWVQETPSASRPVFRVTLPGWQGEIPKTEIVWLRDPDPENPYGRGSGIAEALGDELETDEYAAKHAKAWFYNRAVPDILVGVEGATEEALKSAKQRWEEGHQGFWKAFRSFWHSGNVQVTQLTHSFQQMQLPELRRFERDTIFQVFGAPPEVFGIIENSNRATIDAADYLWSRWVILPRLELLRSEMQERLVPQFDERLILEYVSPVPADREFALKVATAAPWSLTRNEFRAMQELEPVPEGERYYVPAMLIPERAGAAGSESPPEAEDAEEGEPEEPEPEEPEPPKGPPPRRRKALQVEDVDSVLEALRPEYLTSRLDPVFQKLVAEWGQRALDELGIAVSFNLLNPLVVQHLAEKSGTKIRGLVNETTRQVLRESLVEGVRAGEGIPKLAKRVSEVFADAKGRRATVIARTETLNSSNFATWRAHAQSGVVETRKWLSTRDGRARDSHLDMDGQERGIADPFTVVSGENTGATAMHPGGFGIPAEDIQCRCTSYAVIRDPDQAGYTPEQLDQLWKVFDRSLIPWERRIEAAAKRGFQEQETEAIRALNALAAAEGEGS